MVFESGTRYYVRASQVGDGSMYVISDGEYVRQIQHVRHYDRDTNPIIHVSAPLSLFDLEGGLPLRTSPVRSIDRVTDTLEAIAARVATTQPGTEGHAQVAHSWGTAIIAQPQRHIFDAAAKVFFQAAQGVEVEPQHMPRCGCAIFAIFAICLEFDSLCHGASDQTGLPDTRNETEAVSWPSTAPVGSNPSITAR